MAFKEISPYELAANPFELFDRQWTLVTAGSETDCNTMTTAWGSLGIVWNVPAATLFVRPQRYTYEYLQKYNSFTLSFFGPGEERSALRYLGSHSGRNGNKIRESGLTVELFDGTPAFRQARTVLVCRKMYLQAMEKECVQEGFNTEAHYPYDGIFTEENFHHLIMGAIQTAYVKE